MPTIYVKNTSNRVLVIGGGYGRIAPISEKRVVLDTVQIEQLRPALVAFKRAGLLEWRVDYENAEPDGLDAEFITVEDALGGLGGGTTAASPTLVYWPDYVGPATAGIFTDFDALYTSYLTYNAPVNIRFYTSGGPITIPARAGSLPWTFKPGDVFEAPVLSITEVQIADGCLIENVHFFKGVGIRSLSSSSCFTWPYFQTLVGFVLVVLFDGAVFIGNGSAPMITWSAPSFGPGSAILVLTLAQGARFETAGSSVLHVEPAGAWTTLALVQGLVITTVSANTISGADGSGQALLQSRMFSTSARMSLDQPGWTAAWNISSPAAYQTDSQERVTFNYNDNFAVAGSYFVQDFGEFVRCRPDGSLVPIDILLQEARLSTGQKVFVKRDNGDFITVINIVPFGADLIDGLPSYPVPLSAGAVITIVSDGTHWLVM